MTGTFLCIVVPALIWIWRAQIVNLVSDCIAEGLRKHDERKREGAGDGGT